MEKSVCVEVLRGSDGVFALTVEPPSAVQALRQALEQKHTVQDPTVAGDMRVLNTTENDLIDSLSVVARVSGVYGSTVSKHTITITSPKL